MTAIHARVWLVVLPLVVVAATATAQVTEPSQIRYPPLPAFEKPSLNTETLDNGLVVVPLEDHELPLVSIFLRGDAGTRREETGEAGLASLTGALVRTGGTQGRSSEALEDLLDGLGARLEVVVGVDATVASLSCSKADLEICLDVLADVWLTPAFANVGLLARVHDKVGVAKRQVRASLEKSNKSLAAVSSIEFRKLVYGAAPTSARQASVDGLSREQVARFHARTYRPERSVLGIVGDFQRTAALASIRERFGRWPGGAIARGAREERAASAGPGVYWIDKKDGEQQSSIVIGHATIRADDPDFAAAQVLNEVLRNRLLRELRESRALGYQVSSSISVAYDQPGLFQVMALTRPETTVATLEVLQDQIRRVRDAPATADEIAMARNSVRSSFLFGLDTSDGVVLRQMALEFFKYPANFDQRAVLAVDDITSADLHRATRRLIDPSRLLVLVIGDGARFERPLSELGPARLLRGSEL